MGEEDDEAEWLLIGGDPAMISGNIASRMYADGSDAFVAPLARGRRVRPRRGIRGGRSATTKYHRLPSLAGKTCRPSGIGTALSSMAPMRLVVHHGHGQLDVVLLQGGE
jgi:hypothetical protein